jgi:hypothetical protein
VLEKGNTLFLKQPSEGQGPASVPTEINRLNLRTPVLIFSGKLNCEGWLSYNNTRLIKGGNAGDRFPKLPLTRH